MLEGKCEILKSYRIVCVGLSFGRVVIMVAREVTKVKARLTVLGGKFCNAG